MKLLTLVAGALVAAGLLAPAAHAATLSAAATNATGFSAADLASGNLEFTDGDATFDGSVVSSLLEATQTAAQAQTLQGINRISVSNGAAVIDENDRATGIGGPFSVALSLWSDAFTIQGGTGTGTLTVSAAVTGQFGSGYGAEGLYALAAVSEAEAGVIFDDPLGAILGDSVPSPLLLVHQSTTAPQYDAEGERVAPGSAFGDTVSATLQFTYGQPFMLVSMLAGFANDFGSLTAMNSAVFGLTVEGNPSATILTASGALYPAAVPEPETYALFLAGLGLLAVAARRARRAA